MRGLINESRRSVLKTGLGAIGAVGVGSLMSRPARAETITVSGGGDALQQAIDNASDGDTIVVSDSADYNPITIDVDVTIEADDGENPTIVGEGGITSAVEVNSDGVTVRGFRITNDGGLIGVKINPKDRDDGVGYDDVTIEDNLIENLGPTGFLGVSGVVVGNGSYDNITISNNTIQDLENEVGERSRFDPTVNGVLFDAKGSGDDEVVSNAEVTNNTIRRLTSDIAALGIVTQQKLDDVAINNNDISEILVDPGTDSDDSDDNNEPGYAFGQGINITSPSTTDVAVNSNRIEEVTVKNSTDKDVTVFFGESVKIDGDASGAKFRANSFFGPVGFNNQNGADDAPEVDARNNYWGSSKGPDEADRNREADNDDQSEVIGNVRSNPYLSNDPNSGGKGNGNNNGNDDDSKGDKKGRKGKNGNDDK